MERVTRAVFPPQATGCIVNHDIQIIIIMDNYKIRLAQFQPLHGVIML